MLARAATLLEIKRTESARELIAQVLSAEPENVEALCLLARGYYVDRDFTALRGAAERAVALAPDRYDAHVLLAFAQVELDDARSAAISANEAVRLHPDGWHGHAALALAWFNLRRRRRAFRAIRRAVELAPDEAGPHSVRAQMYRALGWTVRAERSYRQALARDPDNTEALTTLGRIATDANRFGTAGEHFGTALATAPTDQATRAELDRLLIGGLAGQCLMGLWGAGFVAMFVMLPKMWLAPLAVLTLLAWWIRRTWRRFPPGVRAYALHLLRADIRGRVRVLTSGLFALTGTAVFATALVQDPDGPPWTGMLIALVAHVLALFGTAIAVKAAERKVARSGSGGLGAQVPAEVRHGERDRAPLA